MIKDLTLSNNIREFVGSVESGKIIVDDQLEKFLGSAVSLAKDYFDRAGEIRLHWMIQRTNGSIARLWLSDHPAGGSVLEMTGPGHMMDKVVAKVAKRFKTENVVRYAFICEAWLSPNLCSPPSLHPNRLEAALVIAEDRVRAIQAVMEIIRPAGQKPYLSKPTDVDVVSACRWTGLLR
jgi:hypothetical protein